MNQSGIKKTEVTNINQILFNVGNFISVSVICSATGVTANAEGKKVLKAGTPITGNLLQRSTAFAKGTDENAVGVLLHDVDVTLGNGNGTLLLFGAINVDRVEADVKALYTPAMVAKLDRLMFLADN